MKVKNRYLPVALFMVLLTACSGIRAYKSQHAPNLFINTRTESGSIFSGIKTAVHIHQVDSRCETVYEGTVQLKNARTGIGVPADRPSYFVFVFSSSSFLGGSSRTIAYETLLKPKTGLTYDVDVRYMDDIYNVEIFERRPGSKTRREVQPVELEACASLR